MQWWIWGFRIAGTETADESGAATAAMLWVGAWGSVAEPRGHCGAGGWGGGTHGRRGQRGAVEHGKMGMQQRGPVKNDPHMLSQNKPAIPDPHQKKHRAKPSYRSMTVSVTEPPFWSMMIRSKPGLPCQKKNWPGKKLVASCSVIEGLTGKAHNKSSLTPSNFLGNDSNLKTFCSRLYRFWTCLSHEHNTRKLC